jgi:hypothetical protein
MKGRTRDYSATGERREARLHLRESGGIPQLQEFSDTWDYRKLKKINKRHIQKFRKERDEWEN